MLTTDHVPESCVFKGILAPNWQMTSSFRYKAVILGNLVALRAQFDFAENFRAASDYSTTFWLRVFVLKDPLGNCIIATYFPMRKRRTMFLVVRVFN